MLLRVLLKSSAWEISSCSICCCGDERLPSLTSITSLALSLNLLICRLQFQANNAQLITANASSGPILETPQRSDLLICLCKRSFLSVPHPGGMSERQPLWMCLRRHSSWLVDRKFPKANNPSKKTITVVGFASMSSEPGLLVVPSVPRSPSSGRMLIVLGTFTYSSRNFLGLSYCSLLFIDAQETRISLVAMHAQQCSLVCSRRSIQTIDTACYCFLFSLLKSHICAQYL